MVKSLDLLCGHALLEELAAGVAALGISIPEGQQRTLIQYLQLLAKWNRTYNLTAIREPAQMVTHHLLDSLAVLPYVKGPRLLDVGSGAGLPGLVLAIADSQLHCVLLDSRGKKTRFLTQAVVELKLSNVKVIQARVESYQPEHAFDTIVSRACASLAAFEAATSRLLVPGGRLLAMKGTHPGAEIDALQHPERTIVHRLAVPGLNAERHLVVIESP